MTINVISAQLDLQMICMKYYRTLMNTLWLFISYIQIINKHDSIKRDQLIEIYERVWDTKLVRLVKMTLENTNNKVKSQRRMSPNSETTAGVRKGDALYTLSFNLHKEKVIRNVKTKPRRNNIQQNMAQPLICRWCDSFWTCGKTCYWNNRIYDNCSIVDWLDCKCIQTKIIIQRNKNGNEQEKIGAGGTQKFLNIYTPG